MSIIISRIWRSAKVGRVVAIGTAIAIGAFVLLLFLASLGDSDLPPYDPPFPGERLGWKGKSNGKSEIMGQGVQHQG